MEQANTVTGEIFKPTSTFVPQQSILHVRRDWTSWALALVLALVIGFGTGVYATNWFMMAEAKKAVALKAILINGEPYELKPYYKEGGTK